MALVDGLLPLVLRLLVTDRISRMKAMILSAQFVTLSRKTRLMEGQKEQVLIRCCVFFAVSDQSLDILEHMSICRKHFSCFLHNKIRIYEYEYVEKVDLGEHGLLLH